MSSSLLSFLSPAKIEEKLPEGVMPKSVSSGSIVQFRQRARYVPTSGSQYVMPSGSRIIQFRITGNEYLDMSTAVLHFRFLNSATATATANILQEGAFSVIQRIRVALNSVIVQDTDNAHIVAHAKVLNTMPRQVYESAQGEYLGLYKKSRALVAASSQPTQNQLYLQISGFYTGVNEGGRGSSFYIPLSLIASSMGMNTFLPLRNVGSLELTFTLEDPANCMFSGTSGTAATSLGYTLSDVSIEVDTVQLASPIVSLMDRLASDVSETGGVVIPVSVDVTQQIQIPNSSGQKSVSISRGTTALTSLCMVKRLQTPANGATGNQTLSSFLCQGQTRSQIRLGGRLYPGTATDSLARSFTETAHAYGMLNNQFAGGLVTRATYEGDSADQGAFSYAYNFRRVLTEELGLDGENSIQGGSVIQYELTDAPSAAVLMTAIIESLRYIELRSSAVNVNGM